VSCLNDVDIQRLADGEGGSELRAHVAECARCAARLEARRRLMTMLAAAASSADEPSPALASRLQQAVRAPTPARGATVLRPSPGRARKPLWAAAAAVAVAAVIVLVVLPRVDAPATLSAAQIIDRSL
jgi:anti-sigma factor RsiW